MDDPVMGGPTIPQMQMSLLREELDKAIAATSEAQQETVYSRLLVNQLRKELDKTVADRDGLRVELMKREREHGARKQADNGKTSVVVEALRALVAASANVSRTEWTSESYDAFEKAEREAQELLNVIDQQKTK